MPAGACLPGAPPPGPGLDPALGKGRGGPGRAWLPACLPALPGRACLPACLPAMPCQAACMRTRARGLPACLPACWQGIKPALAGRGWGKPARPGRPEPACLHSCASSPAFSGNTLPLRRQRFLSGMQSGPVLARIPPGRARFGPARPGLAGSLLPGLRPQGIQTRQLSHLFSLRVLTFAAA